MHVTVVINLQDFRIFFFCDSAGFIAHKMGLPVKLVCVANSNDGIAQMVGSGFYKLSNVKPSLAPAMDIKVWFLCIFN